MLRKIIGVLIVLLLASLPVQTLSEAQQMTSAMTITRYGTVSSTIVAGIIHNITITLSQPSDNLTLRASPSLGFVKGNFTNNYSWSYSSGLWADDLYGYYIKNGSARYENSYCFNIAVDASCVFGNWNFVVLVDDVIVGTHVKQVEVARSSLTMSAPKFYFNLMPYGTGYISSWKPDNVSQSESLSTSNSGNVALTIRFTFESMQTYGTSISFGATNSTGTSLPGAARTHYIDFQAQQWSPREFTVKGYVSGEPQLLVTPNTVSTNTTVRQTFDIVVTVARPGYSIFQMDNVVVQYKKFYNAPYKESLSLDMYLTGNKSVYMGNEMMNLKFNHFQYMGNTTKEDLLLVLKDDVEFNVIANITCSTPPPTLSLANFTFKLADNTATGKLTTNVIVKTSSITEKENELPVSASMLIIAILVIVFVIIGLLLFRVYAKTKEERRRELEDRIRKKKEKAKKRRRV